MTEHRVLQGLESGEFSLLWPVDGKSNSFGVFFGDGDLYLPQRVVRLGTVMVLPGGSWTSYILGERFILKPMVFSISREHAIIAVSRRPRYDGVFIRNLFYRRLLGADRSLPVEARIRPAERIAAETRNMAMHRLSATGRPGDGDAASGEQTPSLLSIGAPYDDDQVASLERYFTSLGVACRSVSQTPLKGKTLTGGRSVLEIKGPLRRLVVSAAFLAYLGAEQEIMLPPEADDEGWWGQALTVLAMVSVKSLLETAGTNRAILLSPGSNLQRSAAPALRFLMALTELVVSDVTRFVDHCYRSQDLVDALRTVYDGFHPRWQSVIDHALGSRRRELFLDRRRPGVGEESLGDRAAAAALLVANSVADRARRRGDAMTARLDLLVRDRFIRPVAEGSAAVFAKHVESGELARALDGASLSRLRQVLRLLPRSVVVDAAVREKREVAMKLSAVYSRRGRRIFFEDLEAREAAVSRDARFDYREIIQARYRVLAVAKRIQL